MNLSLRRLLIELAFNLGVVLAFGMVLIGAGHGVAPIGLILFLGDAEEWVLPMTVGWTAIGLLALAVLVPRLGLHVACVQLGLLTLAAAWMLFLSLSEILPISFLFSIPFLAAMVARLWFLTAEIRRAAETATVSDSQS